MAFTLPDAHPAPHRNATVDPFRLAGIELLPDQPADVEASEKTEHRKWPWGETWTIGHGGSRPPHRDRAKLYHGSGRFRRKGIDRAGTQQVAIPIVTWDHREGR
jgi:hypothetical protein